MRLGVVSDVHGNLAALEAVVEHLRRTRVDAWLCAGDLVGYGPFPNECVDLVRELDAVCVAGNHDLIATGALDGRRAGEWALRTLEWTRAGMRADVHDFLVALPLQAEVDGVVVAHGSLDDPEEYLEDSRRVLRELGRLATEWPTARLLVVGHTHRSLAFSASGHRALRGSPGRADLGAERWLLNPGSIGQPRSWRMGARAMVIDPAAGVAELYVVPYDVEACRRELRARGLPPAGCHLRPALRQTAARIWHRRL